MRKSLLEKRIGDGLEDPEAEAGPSAESRLSEESSDRALEDIRERAEDRSAEDKSESKVRRDNSSRESQMESMQCWRFKVVRLERSWRFFNFLIA